MAVSPPSYDGVNAFLDPGYLPIPAAQDDAEGRFGDQFALYEAV